MKTIPHRELRNNSAAILRAVRDGESFAISNHGEVVATLAPVRGAGMPVPQIRRAIRTGAFADLRREKPSRPTGEVLDELRGER